MYQSHMDPISLGHLFFIFQGPRVNICTMYHTYTHHSYPNLEPNLRLHQPPSFPVPTSSNGSGSVSPVRPCPARRALQHLGSSRCPRKYADRCKNHGLTPSNRGGSDLQPFFYRKPWAMDHWVELYSRFLSKNR